MKKVWVIEVRDNTDEDVWFPEDISIFRNTLIYDYNNRRLRLGLPEDYYNLRKQGLARCVRYARLTESEEKDD